MPEEDYLFRPAYYPVAHRKRVLPASQSHSVSLAFTWRTGGLRSTVGIFAPIAHRNSYFALFQALSVSFRLRCFLSAYFFRLPRISFRLFQPLSHCFRLFQALAKFFSSACPGNKETQNINWQTHVNEKSKPRSDSRPIPKEALRLLPPRNGGDTLT